MTVKGDYFAITRPEYIWGKGDIFHYSTIFPVP